MIFIYHKHDTVIRTEGVSGYEGSKLAKALLEIAGEHPGELLVWCHESLASNLNREVLPDLMHHQKLLYSFNASTSNYLDPVIGFTEEVAPFINVKRDVRYPTWQMSSHVGMVHASVVNASRAYLYAKDHFDYFLTSFAKRAMLCGLLCYSEPRLLTGNFVLSEVRKASVGETFRFVKQHYRMRWTALLLLNIALFRKRWVIASYLRSLFLMRRGFGETALAEIPLQSTRKLVEKGTIDVIIPTIGRKEHLHNVLRDLALQTHLPEKVIIVEQNPEPDSNSELDFITRETWPFPIDHIFTHRTGVCNARNLCLDRCTSEFVFLADDDNRFPPDTIAKAFYFLAKTGNEILITAYPQKGEEVRFKTLSQSAIFGAGNAFAKRSSLDGVRFLNGYEFGYGEDIDFGMQLRNKGFDVLFVPEISILHVKAPMGGFRLQPEVTWKNEDPSPKPSPTVMLYMILNMTKEQVQGYKVVLFFKNYLKGGSVNPLSVYRNFKLRWNKSVYWAHQLSKR